MAPPPLVGQGAKDPAIPAGYDPVAVAKALPEVEDATVTLGDSRLNSARRISLPICPSWIIRLAPEASTR